MTDNISALDLGVSISPEKNRVEGGVLYLVATPVGNLADISARAVKVLSEVDFIAAEDTRNTMRLLSYLGIQKPLLSYFEHNKRSHGELICERLKNGESCALVTDAGTPAISDPGEDIVALCAEKGIKVTSIPGACAAILALTLSGLPTSRFCFEGFLSADKKDRRARLERIRNIEYTLIFHEAPHKLKATLSDMLEILGGSRRISLCRELTKLNEDIFRTTLDGAVEYYSENSPRGEYVLVVEGAAEGSMTSEKDDLLSLSVEEHVAHYISLGMSKKDAIKATAHDRGVPKNDIYIKMI
ncbi:MAG: 16S rRNA (cytidine(1402)-2'-O)-methyltransferase [Clostridia bacterium]|nr:16S rRNA (cytidine(1402)-2'-O)-methyltransferase [Clostridia bacterium]